MPTFTLNLTLPEHCKSRKHIRDWLIGEFLKEEAGQGTGDLSTKYIYAVEQCDTGNTIKIKRPAYLNKGMDFTVHITNIKFREKGGIKDMPSHQEIIDDLLAKKNHDRDKYQLLMAVLRRIYACRHCDEINIHISAGKLSCQEVCLLIKWLWIEQDVTYWNFSGRAMLYQTLEEKELI